MSASAKVLRLIQGSLQAVDVLKADDGALDLVFPRFVGPHAEQIPRAVLHAHFPFLEHRVFYGGPDNLLQFVGFDVRPDFAQPPAHVPGQQVQQFFGRRRETPDAQIVPDHDHREIHVGHEIELVVIGLGQFGVAVLQFLVEGGEFLVAGLQLFLGGFEFLVGTLQLLVGGQNFRVRRLEFFESGFVFINQGMKLLAEMRYFLIRPRQFTRSSSLFHLLFLPPAAGCGGRYGPDCILKCDDI